MAKTVFVPRGVDVIPLDKDKKWDWKPVSKLTVGSMVTGGDILGSVYENSLFKDHRVMVPPGISGRLEYIAPEAPHTIDDEIATIDFNGKKIRLTMV